MEEFVKKVFFVGWLGMVLVLGLFAQAGSYKIGDRGPAGGWIFYDKGEYANGWRYLEVAPEEAEFEAVWGDTDYIIGCSKTDIGSGKENTELIISYSHQEGNDSLRAAILCKELVFSGFGDWFLPSKDELDLIYKNLHKKGIGNFKNANGYWSSSESPNSASFAWLFSFDDGKGEYLPTIGPSVFPNWAKRYVRAVRCF